MTLPERIKAWAVNQGLTHQQGAAATAVFSPDLVHRYALTRTWAPGPHRVYVLLNPSTAAADQDDPTVRRLVGFAQRDGHGGLVLANLFAVRSTDPSILTTGRLDTVGAHNDALLQLLAQAAHDLTVGWGTWGRLQRAATVEKALTAHGARLWALGTTKAGHPRHPLYLPAVARPPAPVRAGRGGPVKELPVKAEEALLGAMLHRPEALPAMRWIPPGTFSRPDHAALWGILHSIHFSKVAKNEIPAAITAAVAQIEDQGIRHTLSPSRISQLANANVCPNRRNAPLYGGMVLETAIHRAVEHAGETLRDTARQAEVDQALKALEQGDRTGKRLA